MRQGTPQAADVSELQNLADVLASVILGGPAAGLERRDESGDLGPLAAAQVSGAGLGRDCAGRLGRRPFLAALTGSVS
jgi:hypothetical protein